MYQPVDEDHTHAQGRRFGVRLSPFVTCDVLAVRGVRALNTQMVAVVTVVRDEVTGVWSASLAHCKRDDLAQPDEDDCA